MTNVTTARSSAQQLRRAMDGGKRPTDCFACIMQDTGAQGYKKESVTVGINEDLVKHREVESHVTWRVYVERRQTCLANVCQ
jgi:hypothetical protein